MYVGMVTFPVRPGRLDEAAALWQQVALPSGETQPGFLRAMLWRDDANGTLVGVGVWRSKADADAYAATGPWRPDSPLHERFDELCSAPPERREFEVLTDTAL